MSKEKNTDPEVNELNEQEETTATTAEENNTDQPEETNDSSGEDDWQAKHDEINDKYLRLYSEFDNFRRRTQREKIDLIKNAGADVIKELLPILDDFSRAIQANEDSEDPAALKEGFQLIHQKMRGILERKGLKPMDSVGKPFDVDHHEAITEIPAPSEEMKGKVVDAVETGYFLNDRVLRYAKVVIGK